MIRAVIFDFDGVILATEEPDLAAWEELYREYGHEFPRERWFENIGTSPPPFDALAHLATLVGPAFDRDLAARRQETRWTGALADLEPLEGVRDRVAEAARLGIRLGIASSSGELYVRSHLERLDLRGFEVVVCREHVAKTKPAPDLYLRALAELRVAAGEALAIEDSPNGIAAAKAAGLRCVAVPTAVTAGLDLSRADLRVPSLRDVTLADLAAPRLAPSPER